MAARLCQLQEKKTEGKARRSETQLRSSLAVQSYVLLINAILLMSQFSLFVLYWRRQKLDLAYVNLGHAFA